MRPKEHVLSQQVLEFLIEHQDNFLIGMQLVSLHFLLDYNGLIAETETKEEKGQDRPFNPIDPDWSQITRSICSARTRTISRARA